jgi:hypothetical protein
MKKLILVLTFLLMASPAFSFSETWSVGPERWFINGVEVPQNIPGAISGDELARKNLPDHLKEYRDALLFNGSAAADRRPEEIHHHDQKKCDREIIIVGGGGGFSHHHRHHFDRKSKFSNHGIGKHRTGRR